MSQMSISFIDPVSSIKCLSAEKAENAVDKGQGMHRTAGYIQINRIFVKEFAVDRRRVLKHSAADSACSHGNNDPRTGHGQQRVLQRIGHVFRNRAGNHDAVGMAWRRHDFNPETGHVYIPGSKTSFSVFSLLEHSEQYVAPLELLICRNLKYLKLPV